MRLPLAQRLNRFVAESGRHVVLRLADADPFSEAQRAETQRLLGEASLVQKAVALLKEKSGVSRIFIAAHKRQHIGPLGEQGDVLRIHHAHYPMMSAACIAHKVLPEIPVLTNDLLVRDLLVVDVGELWSLLAPSRPFVVSVITTKGATNMLVPPGTTVKQILEVLPSSVGSDPHQVVLGSPLLGDICDDIDCVVDTDALTLLSTEAQGFENLPCCNCGKCVKVCPARLLPGLLSKHIHAGQYGDAGNLSVASCIECGCCAYVCPSKRPLVQYMRRGKDETAK